MQASASRAEAIHAEGRCKEAMHRAGHLLARRSRSEREMRDALGSAGFDFATIDRTMARLRQLRLVDDAEFARRWIAERADRRGRVALLAELEAKGVPSDVAAEALEPIEEEARATELAARHLARLGGLPLARQAARIQGMLLRRGFEEEVAEAATRAVLPPEGWD